jgi:hypothetical protein
MKRLFLVVFITLLGVTTIFAEEFSSGLRISLLTCSRGLAASSSYGHSAVRVVDSLSNRDIVFNYGTFSFNEPNFMIKFFRGELDYMLSVSHFYQFIESYKYEKRGVYENVLNLTEKQKVEIYNFLLNNAKDENKYYRYDFIIDNCATRIRDIFAKDDFVFGDDKSLKTYRDNLNIYTFDRSWLNFGTDLILGAKIDGLINITDEMFLPVNLQTDLSMYYNLKKSQLLLYPETTGLNSDMKRNLFWEYLSPIVLFSILFVLALILSLKKKYLRGFQLLYYIVLGLGGLLICFLWFGTFHIWCESNWNLLWLNPLFLVPLFLKRGGFRYYLQLILTAIAAIPVLFFWAIPQVIPIAIIPILLTLILFAVSDQRLKG